MIVHLDADAFYASVEQAADKKLRGKPMAVGGEKRGIIASASYEARKMGVFTPMPTARARKICPGLIVVPGDYQKYDQFSRWMFSYCHDFTPTIEVGGLDEGYLDLSANRKSTALEAATLLRKTILDTLKLSVSFGIASNKLVSSVGSKLNKPAAFREIPTGQERSFLAPLPNRWLPGVGPQLGTTLDAAGLSAIHQIAATPPDLLSMFVGGMAPQLVRFAQGVDDRPVVPERAEAKSYSEQTSFTEDATDDVFIRATLRQMADRLMAKVRAEKKAVRTVFVTIKYNDYDQAQRSESLEEPTDLAPDIYGLADRLLKKAWERRVSLRLVGLKLSGVYDALLPADLALQTGAVPREKQIRIAAVIDELRSQLGPNVLMRGHDLWLQKNPKPRPDLARSGAKSDRPIPIRTKSIIPLNAKSYYSFLDSLMSPTDIVKEAAKAGCRAVALTDPNLHGAVEFYLAAKQAGIKPILGAELCISRSRSARRLNVYVENQNGYANLCHLLSQSHLTEDDFAEHRTGLIELTSGVSHPEWRYRQPGEARSHQIVSSIRTLTLLNEAHPEKRTGNFSFPGELSGETVRAAEDIAERCNFEFETDKLRFPRWIPPDGSSPAEFLHKLAHQGLRQRYQPPSAKLLAQLDEELSMITAVGYEEYFITVWDLLQAVKEAGIQWICRGSAADSLTIYCLGISNFCPVRFEMYFQRFLNLERMKLNKLPDIDIDFPWDKRDEVVEMIFKRYGKEHAAIVGGFSTFQARSALAEVAKVLGVSDRDIRRVTEHLPHGSASDLQQALDSGIESRDAVYHDEPYKTAIQLAAILDGFPRHAKMHPCGVVISGDPIRQHTPTFAAHKNPEWPVTHFNMEAVEQVGLIKLDILAQAGLSVMRDTIQALQGQGITVELPALAPWKDQQVWQMIAKGEARAVHHIESPAMCSLSRESNVRDIDVLVAVVSVIRPGAANGGRKGSFAARACGLEATEYVHPSLESCLKTTFGIMAYEEHVPQICEAFSGMKAGRADVLRRALVKQNHRVIKEMKVEFVRSAEEIGRTPDEIKSVWQLLTEFEGYAFCRAHSTAYAIEAYESAWLKRYHPAQFIAGVLTHERGFYSPLAYTVEARRMGLSFLSPDVNFSSDKFHVEGDSQIRVPLWKIKDLSEGTLKRIQATRPFASLRDFCLRTGAGANEVENMTRVGAFDSFGESRARQVWQARQVSQWPRQGDQGILFGNDSPLTLPEIELTEPTSLDRLRAEMELLGFTVSGHPLDLYPDAPTGSPIASLGQFCGQVVTISAMVIADRVFEQSTGDPMKFLTLADRTGIIETELFAQQYKRFGLQTVRFPVIQVTGKVMPLDNGNGHSFAFQRINPTEFGHQVLVRTTQ